LPNRIVPRAVLLSGCGAKLSVFLRNPHANGRIRLQLPAIHPIAKLTPSLLSDHIQLLAGRNGSDLTIKRPVPDRITDCARNSRNRSPTSALLSGICVFPSAQSGPPVRPLVGGRAAAGCQHESQISPAHCTREAGHAAGNLNFVFRLPLKLYRLISSAVERRRQQPFNQRLGKSIVPASPNFSNGTGREPAVAVKSRSE
jgi:hypothetical protein